MVCCLHVTLADKAVYLCGLKVCMSQDRRHVLGICPTVKEIGCKRPPVSMRMDVIDPGTLANHFEGGLYTCFGQSPVWSFEGRKQAGVAVCPAVEVIG